MSIVSDTADWRPGSFTKHPSWGPTNAGLRQLHEAIRMGFAGELVDVPRDEFRARVKHLGDRALVPMDFFLFSKIHDEVSYLVADELVFQALTAEHSSNFDKLALFVFNFSFAGVWRGARAFQGRPALWAHYYVKERVSDQWRWDTSRVNADDIEQFLRGDARFRAAGGTRKLATNLNGLYRNGRLSEQASTRVERWWVDALFVALDRIIEHRKIDALGTPEGEYGSLLRQSHFPEISGPRSLEKDLATRHLLVLYTACGGRERFADDKVRKLTELKLPDIQWLLANDTRPQGAVHPTNPRILKTIPRACALLAKYLAGFDVIDAEELATFDSEEFVRRRTRSALQSLRDENVRPTMTAEELMRITRER